MELCSFCIDGKTNGLSLRGLVASRLIMFARALSQELRDDELTVSFDHCSRWEAPQGNETGALTRKATRQTKPLKRNTGKPTEGSVQCN
jgi:hypothetical protein